MYFSSTFSMAIVSSAKLISLSQFEQDEMIKKITKTNNDAI